MCEKCAWLDLIFFLHNGMRARIISEDKGKTRAIQPKKDFRWRGEQIESQIWIQRKTAASQAETRGGKNMTNVCEDK